MPLPSVIVLNDGTAQRVLAENLDKAKVLSKLRGVWYVMSIERNGHCLYYADGNETTPGKLGIVGGQS